MGPVPTAFSNHSRTALLLCLGVSCGPCHGLRPNIQVTQSPYLTPPSLSVLLLSAWNLLPPGPDMGETNFSFKGHSCYFQPYSLCTQLLSSVLPAGKCHRQHANRCSNGLHAQGPRELSQTPQFAAPSLRGRLSRIGSPPTFGSWAIGRKAHSFVHYRVCSRQRTNCHGSQCLLDE